MATIITNPLRSIRSLDMFIMNSKRLISIVLAEAKDSLTKPTILALKLPSQGIEKLCDIYSRLLNAHEKAYNFGDEEKPFIICGLGKDNEKRLYMLFLGKDYNEIVGDRILEYLGNPQDCVLSSATYQSGDTIEDLITRLK